MQQLVFIVHTQFTTNTLVEPLICTAYPTICNYATILRTMAVLHKYTAYKLCSHIDQGSYYLGYLLQDDGYAHVGRFAREFHYL